MVRAFSLAIAQLGDPAIVCVLIKSLLVTLAIFIGLGTCAAWLLAGTDPCAIVDADDNCPLGAGTGGLGAIVLMVVAGWFLFPAIAIGVICAYMDEVVRAVEARHYSDALATARPLGWGGAAWLGLRSSLRVAIYNLIALPFYLILMVTGIGPLILFVLVNGAAFGRDLGETVARRHLPRSASRIWLSETGGRRSLLGGCVTAMFLVPFANLIAPIIGAAAATHLFHATRVG